MSRGESLLAALVFATTLAILLLGYQILTRTWEYRAVQHFDCASYLTES